MIHGPRLSEPLTPNEIHARLPALVERLRTLPVRLAYLHGSFLRIDSLTPLSDLDLAFLMEPQPPSGLRGSFLKLNEVCSLVFPDDLADIAILNSAAPEFRFKVIEKGKLFYCQHDQYRAQFEYETFRDYQDTAFLRQEFHRVMVRAIREGQFFG